MRIAVVHSFYSDRQPSGENAVVMDQADELARRGNTVELFSRETDVLRSEPLFQTRSAIRTLTGFGRGASQEIEHFNPDVIHVHNTFPNFSTNSFTSRLSRTLITAHNFRALCAAATFFREGSTCIECLERPSLPAIRHGCYRGSRIASIPLAVASHPRGALRRFYARAASLICLTQAAADTYSAELQRHVEVVPNFVRPLATKWPGRVGNAWLCVGRMSAEKGILPLLKTWPPDARLQIVGSGPLQEAVVEEAARHELVEFLGQLERVDVLQRLTRCKGVIIPSLWAEGLPTVALEALAHGVPLVLSQHVAVAPELEEAGAATCYAPGDNGSSLQLALARVELRREGMRRAALTLYEQRFSPDAWYTRVRALYESVRRT